MKICIQCKEERPVSDFGRIKKGISAFAVCRICREKNRTVPISMTSEEADAAKASGQVLGTHLHRRSEQLKRTYGISAKGYREMYQRQKGKCLICGYVSKVPITDDRRRYDLVVDHCHKSGEVRGLLCGKCNSGLGMFRDNVEFLKGAIGYLLTAAEGLAGKD